MAEYLNQKELLDYLEKLYKFLEDENGQYSPYVEGFYSCMDKVEGFSAVDIQPVRHGQWIYDEKTTNTLLKLTCSKCGWWTINQSVDGSYNYCPKCGAKMDEGEDDGI